jgi:exopolyphosphatase/guanosine-5'-triphosphate,3'-diphosphate pyrophosphatase
MRNQRIAILDLGTNTFNLLVAERKNKEIYFLHREKAGVAFGSGSMQSKQIPNEAVERAIDALNGFKQIAMQLDCAEILAYSTAVLRNAENQEFVLSKIKQATGLNVEIVSGEQEAEWIALASLHVIENSNKSLVLDIGGGSVELIVIENQKIIKLASFPLGVTRLLEMEQWSDPLSDEDIFKIEAHCKQICGDFLVNQEIQMLIGTAGVFETLAEVISDDFQEFDEPISLEIRQIKAVLSSWIRSTSSERNSWDNIIQVRRKALHIASVLMTYIIEETSCENIIVTPNSMAEGAALEYFK